MKSHKTKEAFPRARRRQTAARSSHPLGRLRIEAELNLTASSIEDMDLSDIFANASSEDLGDRDILKDFDRVDLLLKVTERNRAETLFYVAVEASYTVDDGDINRATRNARLISLATGEDAYAVVAGAYVGRDITGTMLRDKYEFVNVNTPDAALWHEVEMRYMEPDPPR